ncbi:MAG: molybdenum cofactor guanylyltransferase MobA [Burkholderiaceae bacterium]
MIAASDVTGLVLAGGLGRRMSDDGSGLDKGLVVLRGRPMVAHVIERFAPQVAALLINANRNANAYRAFGHPVVADDIEGFAGPLAGVHAGLRAARTPYVATVPCDTPFLPADLVARLAGALDVAGADLAVARSGAQPHPVFLLARCSLLAHLEAFLATGRRRVDAWYASLRVAEVDFGDAAAFVNVNTPEDLARLEHAPP